MAKDLKCVHCGSNHRREHKSSCPFKVDGKRTVVMSQCNPRADLSMQDEEITKTRGVLLNSFE